MLERKSDSEIAAVDASARGASLPDRDAGPLLGLQAARINAIRTRKVGRMVGDTLCWLPRKSISGRRGQIAEHKHHSVEVRLQSDALPMRRGVGTGV
jgi:hypothetical protein